MPVTVMGPAAGAAGAAWEPLPDELEPVPDPELAGAACDGCVAGAGVACDEELLDCAAKAAVPASRITPAADPKNARIGGSAFCDGWVCRVLVRMVAVATCGVMRTSRDHRGRPPSSSDQTEPVFGERVSLIRMSRSSRP
ncbi:MAG: hypothetical protein U0625_06390 [Phycisphaerales bacterium]